MALKLKRRTKIWLGVAGLIIVALVSVAMIRRKDRNLVEVTTAKIELADLVSKVSSNGKIEAQRKVDLSANVMGQIVNLAVREGDVVKKGDFLLQIDKAQLAASAAGAEASVKALLFDRDAARASAEEAARNYDRAQKSYSDKVIPLAEVERMRAAVDSARANASSVERRIEQARAGLAGAQDTLSKTTIRAPMNGIVTALPVEEGEVAVIGTMNNPGTILLTISDMSTVEAVMEVDETDIPNVKIGQAATVTVDAYPNKTFAGKVTEVGSSPLGRSASGSSESINFEVKIQLDDPPAGIRPGFSSSADIITGTRPRVPAIPIQALVVREKEVAKDTAPATSSAAKSQEEEGVYKFDPASQKVAFTPVTTGISGESSIEIVTGLKTGDEIVTGPFKSLRDIKDGDRVKLEKKKDKGKDKEDKKG